MPHAFTVELTESLGVAARAAVLYRYCLEQFTLLGDISDGRSPADTLSPLRALRAVNPNFAVWLRYEQELESDIAPSPWLDDIELFRDLLNEGSRAEAARHVVPTLLEAEVTRAVSYLQGVAPFFRAKVSASVREDLGMDPVVPPAHWSTGRGPGRLLLTTLPSACERVAILRVRRQLVHLAVGQIDFGKSGPGGSALALMEDEHLHTFKRAFGSALAETRAGQKGNATYHRLRKAGIPDSHATWAAAEVAVMASVPRVLGRSALTPAAVEAVRTAMLDDARHHQAAYAERLLSTQAGIDPTAMAAAMDDAIPRTPPRLEPGL